MNTESPRLVTVRGTTAAEPLNLQSINPGSRSVGIIDGRLTGSGELDMLSGGLGLVEGLHEVEDVEEPIDQTDFRDGKLLRQLFHCLQNEIRAGDDLKALEISAEIHVGGLSFGSL